MSKDTTVDDIVGYVYDSVIHDGNMTLEQAMERLPDIRREVELLELKARRDELYQNQWNPDESKWIAGEADRINAIDQLIKSKEEE